MKLVNTIIAGAGGIVITNDSVLLVLDRDMEEWAFPKGRVEPNETARQAALREVFEETGVKCQIVRPISSIRHPFELNGVVTTKIVKYFLMSPASSDVRLSEQFQNPDERLTPRWHKVSSALEALAHEDQRDLLLSTWAELLDYDAA